MSIILAIDPGPTNQGYVLYSTCKRRLILSGNVSVAEMRKAVSTIAYRYQGIPQTFIAIEEVQNYGRIVGKDVFLTCRNSGRFQEKWFDPDAAWFASFPKVKTILGVSGKGTNEASVRSWMRDRLGEHHGTPSNKLKGLKATPGPLYGIKDHAWSALAVAIAFDIQNLKANYYS